MAKRRPSGRTGGEHATPRVPYQIPEPFSRLARKLAASRQQPALWLILSLLLKEAREAGIPEQDLPKGPWEDKSQDD